MAQHPAFELHGSHDRLDLARMTREQTWLWERLPSDYQEFLIAANGGMLEENQCTFLTGVPWITENVSNPSSDDCAMEFYGFRPARSRGTSPEDLVGINEVYKEEEFIPSEVIGIGRCATSSLICLSLREDSFGSVWYWDWYWRYPWRGNFFSDRIAAAERAHSHLLPARHDPKHTGRRELADALNFATLIRLADSFTDWTASCTDERA